jgi:ubiquinone/menaquinone biosynthesis C-methylase UbiE
LKRQPEKLKQLVPFVVDALPIFKRRKVKRLLDLGCGAGRHCIYLSKNGFDVVGVDVSRSALKLAKERASEENLKDITFVEATMTNIPFDDRRFDAVLSVSVIHHALKRDIKTTISEIHRILKKRGIFLANLTSMDDPRYGAGEKVEADTFRTLEAYEERRFKELHHYFSKREVYELLSNFSRAIVESLKDRPNYWKITAIK